MIKFLITGNKIIPERHLKQPGFACSACGSLTKNKKKNTNIYRSSRLKIYLSK